MTGALTIPETITCDGSKYTVTAIKGDAFYGSDISSVTIPDSVTSIGLSAFMACTSLESVSIPDTITRIENDTFNYCLKLKSVKLPAKLEYLGIGAFMACDLRSITLPDTLQTICPAAFRDNKNLKRVTVPAFAKFGTDYYCFGFDMINDESVLINGFTMSGYTGSDAEAYAKANKIPFKSLGSVADKYKYTLSRTTYSYSGKNINPM